MSLFHAHCHLRADPVIFEAEGQAQVFYDDANQYLISYRNGVFTIISLLRRDIPPQNLDFVRRGPVLNVRISLDKQHICIQRSHTDVEITGLVNRTETVVSCKAKGQGNMVHGAVWLNNDLCDLVLVTTQGLELFKLSSEGSDVKLVKHDKRVVHWYIYFHPARLLMLCSGKDQSTIQCFQFLPDKLLKMPDFDPDSSSSSNSKRAPLDRASFVACKLYDKLCCIHICAPRQELVVYQLGKEAIGRLCTINLFTACEQFAVSIIDSLLVVHNTDSNITMVFDVWLQQWNSHPIVAPLPLGGPPLTRDNLQDSGLEAYESAAEVIEDWSFIQPSYILDKQAGKLWSIELNLEHIAAGCSDRGTLCRFLLKRAGAKALLLRVLKSCIRDREGLHILFQLFSVVIEAATRPQQQGGVSQGKWWFYLADGGEGLEGETEKSKRPIVTQEDMYQAVWLPLHTAHDIDKDYMMTVLTEYLRALSVYSQVPNAQIVNLLVDISLGEEGLGGEEEEEGGRREYGRVQQLLQYHILPDSVALAQRLLKLQGRFAPFGCLALDMLHRLHAHHDLAQALLANGDVIGAQRYMRRHGGRLAAREVLAAGEAAGDLHSFYWAYQDVLDDSYGGYEGRQRASARLSAEDGCDGYVTVLNRLFPSSAS